MEDKAIGRKRKTGMYLLLFAVTLAVYLVVLIVGNMYPFGDKSFLYQDAYDQYTGIMQTFLEWIYSDDKSIFLWQKGLGVDFLLNIFYYCMSPFNIIAIIMGTDNIELSMTVILVLKASCLAPAALYFFKHSNINRYVDDDLKKGYSQAMSMVMALAYALSGFMLAYNHNVIWMDSLILLPFVAIAVEKLAKNQGRISYILLLALTFFVNFYFAFFIVLFIILYFILQEWNSAKEFIKGALRFLFMSLIGVAVVGVIVIPSLYAITGISSVSSDDYNVSWYTIGNIGNFINSFYPLNELTTKELFNHNNYCGSVILILAGLFLSLKKLKIGYKIKYLAVILFLTVGLNTGGLNYVLHGFTVTHGMGNRFAFILIFILLIMGYVSVLNAKYFKMRYLIALIGMAVLLFIAELFLNDSQGSVYSYPAFMLLFAAYMLIFVFAVRKSIKWKTFYIWIVCLWTAELLVNAYFELADKVTDVRLDETMEVSEWVQEYEDLEVDAGERKTSLINQDYVVYSDTNWYSSMASGTAIDTFNSLGLSHYQNIEYTYRGLTPVTALMYNVRYVLTNETKVLAGYHLLSDDNGIYFYEADELLGLGFVMDDDIVNWTGEKSAAENQNDLVTLASGGQVGEDVFEKVDISEDEISWNGLDILGVDGHTYTYQANNDVSVSIAVNFTADSDMDIYVECSDTRLQGIYAYIDGEMTVTDEYVESSSIVHVGEVSAGQTVRIMLFSGAKYGDVGVKEFEVYSFNQAVFDEFEELVSGNQLEFLGYDGNTMNASISSDKDGILYLAYPYNEGFTIYVDGEEQEVIKLGTGLMGVKITAGYHEIVLEYKTPLLVTGIVVSVLGLCALLVLIFYLRKKRA